MADPIKIQEVSERNAKLLEMRPDKGRLTGVTRARWVDGLRAEVEDGPWTFSVDMPAKAGGEETAPTPGTFGRGALASCLIVSISLWAARMGIPIEALEVEVQGDFDARGELGVGDVQAGYSEVRYVVFIDSPAPEDRLTELLETAEHHSPYIDVFACEQALKRTVCLNGREV